MAFQCLLEGIAASCLSDHGGLPPSRPRRVQAIDCLVVDVNVGHLPGFSLGSKVVSASSVQMVPSSDSPRRLKKCLLGYLA